MCNMVVYGVCSIDLFMTAISRQLVYSYSYVDCKEMLCIANVIGGDETSTGMVWCVDLCGASVTVWLILVVWFGKKTLL